MMVNSENMERHKQQQQQKDWTFNAKDQFTFKSFTDLLVNLITESPSGPLVLIFLASFIVHRVLY